MKLPNLYNDPFCPCNPMEVTVVNKTKNELEFEIHGASETLLGPLMNHTLANSNVEYASYYMGHIVLDNPKFYVRTKKGTPKASVLKAVEKIIADIKITSKAISK
ncbi:MAG: DNA-directed RNA polymerase subunit L [Euryarchaeota archaeon]|nr:DNA-directed RNA polymerase subunit L [Euryarchaeota archaeon]